MFQVPVTFKIYLVFKNTCFPRKIVEFPIHFCLVHYNRSLAENVYKCLQRYVKTKERTNIKDQFILRKGIKYLIN
jgi:hypothetical protein